MRLRAGARYVNAAFMRTPPAMFCGRGPIRGDCSAVAIQVGDEWDADGSRWRR